MQSSSNGRVDPAGVTRIFLRPIGTPLPLGFLALCAATTCVAAVQLAWVPLSQAKMIGWVLLIFEAPLQLLSAIYGFLARDPVAGTGMAVLAGTWAVFGLSWHASGGGATSPGLGVFLIVVAASMLVPVAASVPRKVIAGLVMTGTAGRLAVTGAFELGAGSAVKTASAWLGVALAAVAWYAALALELEGVRHRPILPTFRFGAGRRVMNGSLPEEIEGVHHEAGVRQQL